MGFLVVTSPVTKHGNKTRKEQKMREIEVERYLRNKVKALGGLCLKWVSPGNSGVPDRIVLMPGGWVYFVELKRPDGGELRPLQEAWRNKLRELGFSCWVIKNKAEVDAFIRWELLDE